MSPEQQSPIRFQIDESMWLDHKLDTNRIVSLDLEPEVRVFEEDGIVYIQGHLLLLGRFLPEEEEDVLDLESSSLAEQLQFQPLQVDQKEIYLSENRGKIEKLFPVDVTVPLSKVQRLEDVYVNVENFDYVTSGDNGLNITADIVLLGVENGIRVDNTGQQEASLANEDERIEKEIHKGLSQEKTPEEEQAGEAQTGERQAGENKAEEGQQAETSATEQEEVQLEESDVRPADGQEEKTEETLQDEKDDLSVGKYQEDESEKSVASLFDGVIKTNFKSSLSTEEKRSADIEYGNENKNEDIQEEQQEGQETKTTSFLTTLLSGDSDEERLPYSKLKMCIVQRDESLEQIATRYEVSIEQILRVNKLQDEHIVAGQIVYIPQI